MTVGPDSDPLELAFSLVIESSAPPEVGAGDLEKISSLVLVEETATGHWEVTVALVDDERLQALHRDFMGINEPTDIMTFPIGDSGESPQGGELIISMDHALTRAGAWGLSPTDEIRFLVIHGLLHLLGWRDDTAEERERMLARQQHLFDRFLAGL